MTMQIGKFVIVAFVILVWGVTFVNTRALLADFSALEIVVARFVLASGGETAIAAFQKI